MCRKNGVNGAWYRPQFQTPPGGLGAYSPGVWAWPSLCGSHSGGTVFRPGAGLTRQETLSVTLLTFL